MKRIRHPFKYRYDKMKSRCNNPNDPDYKHYGGRGIKVAEEFSTFRKFLANMPPGFKDGLTLERKDVDGPYSRENTEWISRRNQMYNLRETKLIYDIKHGDYVDRLTLSERTGIPIDTISQRDRLGWGPERIQAPLRYKNSVSRKFGIDKIKEAKRLLWTHSVEDVVQLTNLPQKLVSKIHDRVEYDDVDEFN